VTDDRRDYWQSVSDDTRESLSNALRDFMRWIYRSLETEYDYLTSEEQIAESIIINGYEFDEYGEIA